MYTRSLPCEFVSFFAVDDIVFELRRITCVEPGIPADFKKKTFARAPRGDRSVCVKDGGTYVLSILLHFVVVVRVFRFSVTCVICQGVVVSHVDVSVPPCA